MSVRSQPPRNSSNIFIGTQQLHQQQRTAPAATCQQVQVWAGQRPRRWASLGTLMTQSANAHPSQSSASCPAAREVVERLVCAWGKLTSNQGLRRMGRLLQGSRIYRLYLCQRGLSASRSERTHRCALLVPPLQLARRAHARAPCSLAAAKKRLEPPHDLTALRYLLPGLPGFRTTSRFLLLRTNRTNLLQFVLFLAFVLDAQELVQPTSKTGSTSSTNFKGNGIQYKNASRNLHLYGVWDGLQLLKRSLVLQFVLGW